MLTKRIIPCLDCDLGIKGGRVVKGVKFKEIRYAGVPWELAERYYKEGADEIVFLDINIKGREDGIEVATVLRKGFDFYAIFLSAHINPAIIDRVKDFSNSDFIKKPFEIETVLESIERAKRTYRLHEIEE